MGYIGQYSNVIYNIYLYINANTTNILIINLLIQNHNVI